MEPLRSIGERYWIAYYLVYVITAGVGAWRYQPWQETGKDELYASVAIFALAAGVALLAAILMEVTGRMVLLIPAEIKRLKELGRKEGRQEGRDEERKRIADALVKAGVRAGDSDEPLTPSQINEIVRGSNEERA